MTSSFYCTLRIVPQFQQRDHMFLQIYPLGYNLLHRYPHTPWETSFECVGENVCKLHHGTRILLGDVTSVEYILKNRQCSFITSITVLTLNYFLSYNFKHKRTSVVYENVCYQLQNLPFSHRNLLPKQVFQIALQQVIADIQKTNWFDSQRFHY